eukprot:TRINITY_DN11733_c0_g1_i1.p1 TRINITY_DN11733_c0_g1~~TRINITY_DN11733_c0_g1_i1.p1  ORF type:complete len:325 (+),score=42.77 TRINITY_DN11733_c0_g1_i1:118-1092(+)
MMFKEMSRQDTSSSTQSHLYSMLSERSSQEIPDFEKEFISVCLRVSALETKNAELSETRERIQTLVNFYLDSELEEVSSNASWCCGRCTRSGPMRQDGVLRSLMNATNITLTEGNAAIGRKSDYELYVALRNELDTITELQDVLTMGESSEFQVIQEMFDELLGFLFGEAESPERKSQEISTPQPAPWTERKWYMLCSFLSQNFEWNPLEFAGASRNVMEDYFDTKQQCWGLVKKCLQKKEEMKSMLQKMEAKKSQHELALRLSSGPSSPKFNAYRSILEKEFKSQDSTMDAIKERALNLEKDTYEQIHLNFLSLKSRIIVKKP